MTRRKRRPLCAELMQVTLERLTMLGLAHCVHQVARVGVVVEWLGRFLLDQLDPTVAYGRAAVERLVERQSTVRTGDGMGRGCHKLTPHALRYAAELPAEPRTLLLCVCGYPALRRIAPNYRACGPGVKAAEMLVA